MTTWRKDRPSVAWRVRMATEGIWTRLPDPILRPLRTAYRRLQSNADVQSLALAPDMIDERFLREYLADTDIFPDRAEGIGYLNDAFLRFRITMSIIPPIPDGARVLELGANPYFVTSLLRRRGYQVTCANYFGRTSGLGSRGVQVVTSQRTGERTTYEFDHFDLEDEFFPYPDGAFDLVLFGEILEHLPHDATHPLAEIHRVLAEPDGWLVLTTPNAVRAENMAKMAAGDNVYEQLSGNGIYGRHNRVYTRVELERLLDELGYCDVSVFVTDIHQAVDDNSESPAEVHSSPRGYNLFAVARPFGPPRWRYPPWLYTSRAGYRQIVRPDVTVGINDEVQASGLHDLERTTDVEYCWTGADPAVFELKAERAGRHLLVIEGAGPPAVVKPELRLSASLGGHHVDWQVPSDGRPFRFEAPVETSEGRVEVTLATDHTWQPVHVGAGQDGRNLGVRLTRVAIELVE